MPTPQPTEFASSVHLYSQNGRYLYRIKPDAAARLLALRRVSRMGKGSGKLRSLQLVDSLVTAQDMGQRVATTVHGSGIGQTSEAPVAGERGRPVHCWHMHCTDAEGRVFAPPDAQEEFLQVLFECGAQPVVKQIKKGNR